MNNSSSNDGLRNRNKSTADEANESNTQSQAKDDDMDEDEDFDDDMDLSDIEEDDENFNLTEGERATGHARVAEVKATIQEEQRQRQASIGGQSISFQQRLGSTVQRPEIQVIMLILICIDVAAALIQIFLSNGIIPGSKTGTMVRLGKFLEYESAVTIMVFIIEMLVAVISFGFSLLSHPGYSMDLIIVISQVYFSAVYDSVAIRLLGILRLWRLLRLVDKILEDEKDAHAYTLEQLDRDRARVDDLLAQLREKDHGLKHEKEKLNRANEMLRNYKDDNAWLVDALHIAAEHAANAGGMPQGGRVPASSLRGDVSSNNFGGSKNNNINSSIIGASNLSKTSKNTKGKRAKIKIGKDGVQRLVRE